MLNTESALRKDQRNANAATFEHRHFAKVAAIIKDIPDAGYRADMARHFADELAGTNPRFNRARFLRACVVDA